MGGSGGSSFPAGPTNIDQLRERAREIADQATVDAGVNELLTQKLTTINDRDVEKVGRHLDGILEALEGEIDGVERTLFGGSVAKHTYVDGLSDIDALVVLRQTDGQDATPQQIKEQFQESLERQIAKIGAESVRSGDLAVTVRYSDGTEIQLLPAVQRGDRHGISSQDGSKWKLIHPRSFARELTDVNKKQGKAVIPTIKLAKSIIANTIPEAARPASYHVEALAVAAFRDYAGSRSPKAMLSHFFAEAARGVLRPIKDVSGQSHHVDSYLDAPGSNARTQMSSTLQKIANTMENSRQPGDWHVLLGDD
jgi:hypothetical protein